MGHVKHVLQQFLNSLQKSLTKKLPPSCTAWGHGASTAQPHTASVTVHDTGWESLWPRTEAPGNEHT